jgi:hypothetical protein
MAMAQEWADGFARQADADFHAWEFFEADSQFPAPPCHKLLFLQMTCEKLCKAHMIRSGTNPNDVITTHRVIAKNLRWLFGKR